MSEYSEKQKRENSKQRSENPNKEKSQNSKRHKSEEIKVNSSNHELHQFDHLNNKFIPIVYNENYDIHFYKFEWLHPFDTGKWGKIAKHLEDYFNKSQDEKPFVNNNSVLFISPKRPIKNSELLIVHTEKFVENINESRWTVSKAAEVALIVFIPMCIVRKKLITPLKWQTAGSILSSFIALKYGWAIHLGGGFHHCSAKEAGGFCLFADITLIIRYLWREVNQSIKFMIIDCDAHQGNGYARDVLNMNKSEQEKVYILDMFNPRIYPGDRIAREAIDREVHVKSGTDDDEYHKLLTFHLDQAIKEFKPDFIIYNAGTDILIGDRLGNLRITPEGIAKRDEIVFIKAKQINCPIVMLTSGGYQRNNAEIIARSIQSLFDKKIIEFVE